MSAARRPERNALPQVEFGIDLLERERWGVGQRRRPQQEMTATLRPADEPRFERGGRGGADDDLAGVSGSLHLHHRTRTGTGHDELAMGFTDEKEVEQAAVHPDGHAE